MCTFCEKADIAPWRLAEAGRGELDVSRSARKAWAAVDSQHRDGLRTIIARMNSSSQISVRAFSAASKNIASDASSLIEVHLSSNPDPRWRACFNFVLQGREIAYLQDSPVFDHASFKATLLPGYADAFRQELPELIAAASVLARAQATKDAGR